MKKDMGIIDKTLLDKELLKINSEEIRSFTGKILSNVPDYFWDPEFKASSSGKYHLEVDGKVESLIDHTKRVFSISRIIIGNPLFSDILLSKEDQDCLMSACLLHDSVKRGFDENDLTHTKFEHPIYVSQLARDILSKEELERPFVNKILKMVESHSGPWNKSSRSNVELPTPETFLEILCHFCDYFASRQGIFVDHTKLSEK